MLLAERPNSRFVNNLKNEVRASEVVPRSLPNIVEVEHHLRKEPVTRAICRGIYKVRCSACELDGEWQKVRGAGIDVEVRFSSSDILPTADGQRGKGRVVDVEEIAALVEIAKSLRASVSGNAIIHGERQRCC